MNILRWLLAIGIVLAGIGFGAFVILANTFRRSFGASENNLLIAVIPVILSLAAAWWLVRKPAAPLPPEALSYPVLLVEQDKTSKFASPWKNLRSARKTRITSSSSASTSWAPRPRMEADATSPVRGKP